MKNPNSQFQNPKSQSGNALFIILIAVALFGALSFAVSNMMRSGSESGLTDEKVGLYAGEIMDYGRKMKQAVQAVRINYGCEDTDISFNNNIVSGYNFSTDDDCEIFNGANSGMVWMSPGRQYNDTTEWLITGSNIVDGMGTSSPDLVLMLRELNSDICSKINENLGISASGSDGDIDFTQFTGSYASTETLDDASGNTSGCLNYNDGDDHYFFYQVLLAR